MNEMIIFENEQFGTVRIIEQDGEAGRRTVNLRCQ